jgi:hypothetical protein
MTSDPGESCELLTYSSFETLYTSRGLLQIRQVHGNSNSEITEQQEGIVVEGIGIVQRCSIPESTRTSDSYPGKLCPR